MCGVVVGVVGFSRGVIVMVGVVNVWCCYSGGGL